MNNKNNKWASYQLTMSLFLVLCGVISFPLQAEVKRINGIAVDMALENQLDNYLSTLRNKESNSKAVLLEVLNQLSEQTPLATKVRARSYEVFWFYYEGQTEKAFEKLDKLLSLAKNSELADVKTEIRATQVELLQAEGKSGEAFLLINDIEIPLSNARIPRIRFYAHNLISRIYANWNRYDEALRHMLLAQEAVNETDNARTPIRKQFLHYSIAKIQSELKNWEGSLATVNQAINSARMNGLESELPDLYLHKSYVEAAMNRREASLVSLNAAYDAAIKDERENLLPIILNNYGDHFMYEEKWDEARSYLRKAEGLAEKVDDKYLVQTIHFNLGSVNVRQGNTEEGFKEMLEALEFYRDEGIKIEVEGLLGELAQAYEFAGQYQKQAAALKQKVELMKDLYQKDRQQNLANLQQLYASKDKEQQIELLKRQNELKQHLLEINEQRKLIWLLFAVVAACALVFIFLMYRKSRQTNLSLREANSLLAEQSRKDPLTGLWNRRALQEEMEEREKHGGRRRASTHSDGLILLDIDFFKRINDKYGHTGGDKVLTEVSQRLQKECRVSDKLIRWGGEEFLFLVRNVNGDDLEEMSERLLQQVAKDPIIYEGKEIFVTTTIGFIRLPFSGISEQEMDWEKVLQVADMALYTGKANGRNRACGITELHIAYEKARSVLESDLPKALSNGWVSMITIEGPNVPENPE